MTRIVLASNSPRRKELLERVGAEFIIDASSIDEVVREHETPEQIAMGLALEKGLDVASRHDEGTLIIAADTIVYHELPLSLLNFCSLPLDITKKCNYNNI